MGSPLDQPCSWPRALMSRLVCPVTGTGVRSKFGTTSHVVPRRLRQHYYGIESRQRMISSSSEQSQPHEVMKHNNTLLLQPHLTSSLALVAKGLDNLAGGRRNCLIFWSEALGFGPDLGDMLRTYDLGGKTSQGRRYPWLLKVVIFGQHIDNLTLSNTYTYMIVKK